MFPNMKCLRKKSVSNCIIAILTLFGLCYFYLVVLKAQISNPFILTESQSRESVYILINENDSPVIQEQIRSKNENSPAVDMRIKDGQDKKENNTLGTAVPSRHIGTTFDMNKIRNRFLKRNYLAQTKCQRYSHESKASPMTNVVPYAYGQLEWCMVYKVASSFLLQYDTILSRKNKWNRFPWNVFPLSLYLHYRKPRRFMVVREPYARMVSAYIDRLVTSPDKWDSVGQRIVYTFRRRDDSNHVKLCGDDVTFPEFIKYFIHSQENEAEHDGHFAPMSESCDPCQTRFDFISHYETLQEDMTFVFKSANLSTENIHYHLEPALIKAKVKSQLKKSKQITRCKTMCQHLHTLWWAFQARGLIAKDLPFPLSQAQCDDKSWWEKFPDICWDAHLQTKGRINKNEGERQATVELFLQVPLDDRIKVRNLLAKDFELFGFESQPRDIFPELK